MVLTTYIIYDIIIAHESDTISCFVDLQNHINIDNPFLKLFFEKFIVSDMKLGFYLCHVLLRLSKSLI